MICICREVQKYPELYEANFSKKPKLPMIKFLVRQIKPIIADEEEYLNNLKRGVNNLEDIWPNDIIRTIRREVISWMVNVLGDDFNERKKRKWKLMLRNGPDKCPNYYWTTEEEGDDDDDDDENVDEDEDDDLLMFCGCIQIDL